MNGYRYFAVPVLNSHRREENVHIEVDAAEGVMVALGMEIGYAAPPLFPSPSRFVERVLNRFEKCHGQLDKEVRTRVIEVAQDEEVSDPYLVAPGSSCLHGEKGEISLETAARLAIDGNGPAKLPEVLKRPSEFVVQMRFRDVRQLLFQVDGRIDPTQLTVRAFAGKVLMVTFPLYVPPILPKRPES